MPAAKSHLTSHRYVHTGTHRYTQVAADRSGEARGNVPSPCDFNIWITAWEGRRARGREAGRRGEREREREKEREEGGRRGEGKVMQREGRKEGMKGNDCKT